MKPLTEEQLKMRTIRIKDWAFQNRLEDEERKIAEREKKTNPYFPFTDKEGYDLAIEAGYPTDPKWLQKLIDLAKEREHKG